jgi:fructose-bisphosphate aldolase, class I
MAIFSGGTWKENSVILDDIRAIRAGSGFGSIIGRNSFQREWSTAMELLDHTVRIYKGETPQRRRNQRE